MRKIFVSPDQLLVRSLAAFMEDRGVKVHLRGDDRAALAGALPPNECWTELLLVDDQQEELARTALLDFSATRVSTGRWTCPQCGEELENQFTDCWRCHPITVTAIAPDARYVTIFRSLVAMQVAISVVYHHFVSTSLVQIMPGIEEYSRLVSRSLPRGFDESLLILQGMAWVGLLVWWNVARFLNAFLWGARLVVILVMADTVAISGPTLTCTLVDSAVCGGLLAMSFSWPLRLRFDAAVKE